jgi:hypothetical protein
MGKALQCFEHFRRGSYQTGVCFILHFIPSARDLSYGIERGSAYFQACPPVVGENVSFSVSCPYMPRAGCVCVCAHRFFVVVQSINLNPFDSITLAI